MDQSIARNRLPLFGLESFQTCFCYFCHTFRCSFTFGVGAATRASTEFIFGGNNPLNPATRAPTMPLKTLSFEHKLGRIEATLKSSDFYVFLVFESYSTGTTNPRTHLSLYLSPSLSCLLILFVDFLQESSMSSVSLARIWN